MRHGCIEATPCLPGAAAYLTREWSITTRIGFGACGRRPLCAYGASVHGRSGSCAFRKPAATQQKMITEAVATNVPSATRLSAPP